MCRAKDQWEACSHISQNHVTPYYKVENESVTVINVWCTL